MLGMRPAYTDTTDDEGKVSLARRLVLEKCNNLLVERQQAGEKLIYNE